MDKSADDLATAAPNLRKQQRNEAQDAYKDEATNMAEYEAKLPEAVLTEELTIEDPRLRIQAAKDTIDVEKTTPARPTGLTDKEKMEILAAELDGFPRRASHHGELQLEAHQEREQFKELVRQNVQSLLAGLIAGDEAPPAKLTSYAALDRESALRPHFVKDLEAFKAEHKGDVQHFGIAQLQRYLSLDQSHEVTDAICRSTMSTRTQSKGATRSAAPAFDMDHTAIRTAAGGNSTTTAHNNYRGGRRGGYQGRQGRGQRSSYPGRGGYYGEGHPSPFNDHRVQYTDFNENGKRPAAYGVSTTAANSKRRTHNGAHFSLPAGEKRRRYERGLCFKCSAWGHVAKSCTN